MVRDVHHVVHQIVVRVENVQAVVEVIIHIHMSVIVQDVVIRYHLVQDVAHVVHQIVVHVENVQAAVEGIQLTHVDAQHVVQLYQVMEADVAHVAHQIVVHVEGVQTVVVDIHVLIVMEKVVGGEIVVRVLVEQYQQLSSK